MKSMKFDSHSKFLLQMVYKQQSLFKEESRNKGMNGRKLSLAPECISSLSELSKQFWSLAVFLLDIVRRGSRVFGYKDYDKANYFGVNSMWNLWIMFGTPLAQTLLLTWHARPPGGGVRLFHIKWYIYYVTPQTQL